LIQRQESFTVIMNLRRQGLLAPVGGHVYLGFISLSFGQNVCQGVIHAAAFTLVYWLITTGRNCITLDFNSTEKMWTIRIHNK
jgi:hypothetical protein